MHRTKTQNTNNLNTGLVALHDVQPWNRMGLVLQSQGSVHEIYMTRHRKKFEWLKN